MKKTVSLILSAVMLICSVFCVNLSALADYDNILALNQSTKVTINNSGELVVLQFTPQRTSTFVFSSHTDSQEIVNPYCMIRDASGNRVGDEDTYDTTPDGTPNAFSATVNLEKDITYHFICGAYTVPSEYSVVISYKSIPVTTVLLDKTETTYNQNEQGTLTASVSPGNATNARVNAQTEETDIITSISVGEPSEDGKSKITFNTGSKAGKATVTVCSVETSAVKKTCTVYVKEATPSISIDSENEALNGFVIGEKYKIYGSEIESVEFTAQAESIAIDEGWYGKTVSIVKLNDEPKCNSNAQGLQISAPQPAEPPAQVTGLATTARGANGVNLTLSWNAVDGATGYNVYGYNKPADSWTLLDTVTTNKYISPTTPGYEYYFRVAAVNGDVEGTPSDALHTCAACETMDAPSVIASNDKTIQVDWNLVGSHGYVVMWSKDASFKTGVSSKYITGHSKSSYTIGVPSGANQYYVRVRAWRNWETGYVYGSWSEGVKAGQAIAKVTGLKTSARGANGVNLTISWNAQAAADSYNVYGYNKANDSWTLLGNVTTNKYISPTTPGYEYIFRVAAVEDGREGVPSERLHTCAACETMKAPTVQKSGSQIKVNWEIVGSHGYVVMWSTDPTFKTGVSSKYITGHSKSNYTISVPSGAGQYYVRVRAWRNWETGYVYGSWSEGVKAGQTIAKVTGLKTSARGANGVNLTISWNVQAAADSYNVYGYNKANDSWTLLDTVSTNKYISPTTPGYEYIFRVAAVADGREGVPSERLHTCAACDTMKAPTVQKSGSQIKVNWEIVGSHGYVVMWSTDPTFKTGVSSKYITGHSVNNYTITGINSNQTYYVRVRAWRNWDTGYVYGSWSESTIAK